MTKMKNKSSQGPDLEAIIDGLTNPTGAVRDTTQPLPYNGNNLGTDHQGRLWDDFIDTLNEKDSEIERTKLYAIDDDIVETLHQCNFGHPNVHVINSILRTFLVDNIPKLKEMYRPRSKSLLDKYD